MNKEQPLKLLIQNKNLSSNQEGQTIKTIFSKKIHFI